MDITRIDVDNMRRETPGITQAQDASLAAIHFDANVAGLMCSPVLVAMKRALEIEASMGAIQAFEKNGEMIEKLHNSLAALIHCSATDIYVLENISSAINMVLRNMFLRSGDRVIVSGLDQYTLRLLEICAQLSDVYIDVVNLSEDGTIDMSSLSNLLTHEKARLMVVAHIPVSSKHVVNNLSAICLLAQDFRVPVFLDASSSIGLMEINVEMTPAISFVFASGSRYLRGPQGVDFLYTSPQSSSARQPQPIGGADNFQCSFSGQIGLLFAVEYAMSIGVQRIFNHVSVLTAYLLGLLRNLRHVHVRNNSSTAGSNIVIFSLPVSMTEIKQSLQANGIYLSYNTSQNVLEASLFYYNTHAEIDFVVTQIGNLLHMHGYSIPAPARAPLECDLMAESWVEIDFPSDRGSTVGVLSKPVVVKTPAHKPVPPPSSVPSPPSTSLRGRVTQFGMSLFSKKETAKATTPAVVMKYTAGNGSEPMVEYQYPRHEQSVRTVPLQMPPLPPASDVINNIPSDEDVGDECSSQSPHSPAYPEPFADETPQMAFLQSVLPQTTSHGANEQGQTPSPAVSDRMGSSCHGHGIVAGVRGFHITEDVGETLFSSDEDLPILPSHSWNGGATQLNGGVKFDIGSDSSSSGDEDSSSAVPISSHLYPGSTSAPRGIPNSFPRYGLDHQIGLDSQSIGLKFSQSPEGILSLADGKDAFSPPKSRTAQGGLRELIPRSHTHQGLLQFMSPLYRVSSCPVLLSTSPPQSNPVGFHQPLVAQVHTARTTPPVQPSKAKAVAYPNNCALPPWMD